MKTKRDALGYGKSFGSQTSLTSTGVSYICPEPREWGLVGHTLCASMSSLHRSSPFMTMHSSRIFLVSGQEQQIFFPDFPST